LVLAAEGLARWSDGSEIASNKKIGAQASFYAGCEGLAVGLLHRSGLRASALRFKPENISSV
jgi:hypothetical protein